MLHLNVWLECSLATVRPPFWLFSLRMCVSLLQTLVKISSPPFLLSVFSSIHIFQQKLQVHSVTCNLFYWWQSLRKFHSSHLNRQNRTAQHYKLNTDWLKIDSRQIVDSKNCYFQAHLSICLPTDFSTK